MKSDITLTIKQARALQLAATGLLEAPKRAAKKADVLAAIRNMNMLQIDTISVVERSQYFVLWSRLGHYKNQWLDELLTEGKLFEYWAHAACLLPIEHYANYRYCMLNLEKVGSTRSAERLKTHRKALNVLRKHIRNNGEVRATDFERPNGAKGNGWWDWKPEKLLLETLYTAGELMVARREGFHRIYDLRERVLPPHLRDVKPPARPALEREWTLAAIKAMGVATGRWIGDYFRHAKRVPRPSPEALVDSGELLRVNVEGLPHVAYVHSAHANVLKQVLKGKLQATHTTLLSPFDPLVWDRERTLALFDFDYRLECYTPEHKRIYGYFALPILRNGELVGRLEAKAHRSDGIFEIRHIHLEPRIKPDESLAVDLASAVARCAQWHDTPNVVVTRSSPTKFAAMLRKAMPRGASRNIVAS
jgi:uncharacterized protein